MLLRSRKAAGKALAAYMEGTEFLGLKNDFGQEIMVEQLKTVAQPGQNNHSNV